MNQIVESFRHSQDMLFSALDGHDSEAIFEASQQLGQAASQLGALDKTELKPSLQPLLSEADELMQASIYRLRFLRDHSATRLQLLAGWRESQANTYSGTANGR
ncbi:hypothetical protein [Parasphingorhabdus cellanae]|uniref:Flagellar protein FliT n=1 Tax=Parasphingorhabdus cellanae TaxID=2806553 RepID=A0ABX7T1K5_9SPHN|nr:hypothetical protein [Parasphingorhabdus cellanae]QTD55446.1 hypothetical protein J4G78_14725 [Parasphingorhabdus cellanae]